MAAYKARLEQFKDALSKSELDIKKIRELSFQGCPFESGYRSICWKILLEHLPLKRDEWPKHLQRQRATYKQFINELIIIPGEKAYLGALADGKLEDHPLNPNPDSQWSVQFKDNDMLMQIDKDCRRLCPDLSFFQSATKFPCNEIIHAKSNVETLRKRVEHTVLKSETVGRNRLGITNMQSTRRRTSDEYALLPDGQEAHWEVVERILFIYAKLNPGLNYVQGMNEILGPIYYTFASDPDPECKEYAEADSFFCFTNLMAEIRDHFIKTLDDSDCGIGYSMTRLMEEIHIRDPCLSHRMTEQDLKPQYFAFRWITLMLSQEFPLPDVLRIWDSLFADKNRFDFLITVCCSMLILLRNEILSNDFPSNMKLLQNFPYTTVEVIKVISKAVEMLHR
ncbi:hypothetical protein SNE40_000072 [Patella caerulea]|uniref:TBC1 domain family member 13 n=1 Tax=Patella caerulea TaxID=87958 RepID=A0AAN8KG84_PATCE